MAQRLYPTHILACISSYLTREITALYRTRIFSILIVLNAQYHIYSAMVFPLSRMTTNNQISPLKFCYTVICNFFPFQNNPKDLDPSYKTDLDFWDCFGKEKLHLITEEI